MAKHLLLSLLLLLAPYLMQAQDDLLDLAEALDSTEAGYVSGTFKATRLVNGHSVETNGDQELLFLISHRFGTLNSGAYNLFGLDQATIRLALEYGLTDRLTLGLGRSSLEKTYDGFAKYRILRQLQGAMPVTVTGFSSLAIKTLEQQLPERPTAFSSRLTYTHQLLIARKFTERLSLQLSPTWVHRNMVATRQDENEVYALGLGGRYKLTKRTSFNAEYYYLLPGETADQYRNALAMGFDIETGGHVFQLIFTNAQGMVEKLFIPQTQGAWEEGDVYFGFNISRVFSLKKEGDW
ncbi:hypothetical protein CLV24_12427 [Pontibacter ummariensis]|uniref:DUF5777 domain-containing protein n=1 Tax=Pontibacter ummariensis TaxID=1610492 RepID=A0A239JWM0_9BACT|nr:DUF5777 family beta-barrel protein [Pontibacter ummariensis]PRY07289.1 hypothetical protein CLV24_12427 [Pontibacter ummariensis]SNT10366.1 hypothetical protein SAMN06296052_12437 [Pontibacter ummariensis]